MISYSRAVVLEVARVHALQVVLEALPGQQALLQAVPVAELDEGGVRQRQLVAVGALGLLREVVGQLVALEVERRQLPDHPLVELDVGELLLHELAHRARVLDLALVVLEVAFGERQRGPWRLRSASRSA